jgi:hypothetical protein
LDQASARIASAFPDAPEDEAQLCQKLGDAFGKLGEHDRAEQSMRRAFTL